MSPGSHWRGRHFSETLGGNCPNSQRNGQAPLQGWKLGEAKGPTRGSPPAPFSMPVKPEHTGMAVTKKNGVSHTTPTCLADVCAPALPRSTGRRGAGKRNALPQADSGGNLPLHPKRVAQLPTHDCSGRERSQSTGRIRCSHKYLPNGHTRARSWCSARTTARGHVHKTAMDEGGFAGSQSVLPTNLLYGACSSLITNMPAVLYRASHLSKMMNHSYFYCIQ